MKTVDLVATPPTTEALLDLASEDSMLIRMPNGKAFLITQVDETLEEADFADEVAHTRRNQALMALLAERSKEAGKHSLDQVRERLGLNCA
ncbi:MAG: hypothetical protein R3C14_03090 [Caldilineaceae bacterium]